MTDDERLLEIATRLMAGILGNQTLKVTAKADGATDIEAIAACSFAAADAILNEWRERTGAREERGQDVSDELLRNAISAARLATELTTNRQTAELFGDLSLELEKIQRARAREASSRDDTPERGQDVSVEMLQRAAVACRSAAAMWYAIPTKSEYWCETADYFDKRARAAGKGEG